MRDEQEQNDVLGRLFRIAGARPAVPADAGMRVRSAVELQWRKAVRAHQRKTSVLISVALIAASLLVFTLCRFFLVQKDPATVAVGFVQDIKGEVSAVLPESKGIASQMSAGDTLFSNMQLSSGSGHVLLHLLNGVTVRLDVNSKLQVRSESALILHEGAAYLDCGRAAKSIELRTILGTVKDEGTQFEVRLQSDRMHVTVREGAVFLTRKGVQRTVQAGKQLTVDQKGVLFYDEVPTYGPHWNWLSEVAPSFRLEGRTLMEFLQWVSRENGWRLVFADSRIEQSSAKIVLHGSVAGLQMQEMPGAVLPVCGLSYSAENGVFTVKPGKTK